MTDDGTITNRMLLEHIQAFKYELSQKIEILSDRMERGFADVDRQFMGVWNQFTGIKNQLEDARLHREAIQEDLEATIRMQSNHQKQLANMGKKK